MSQTGGFLPFLGTRSGDEVAPIPDLPALTAAGPDANDDQERDQRRVDEPWPAPQTIVSGSCEATFA
jgi:hypothetical protein